MQVMCVSENLECLTFSKANQLSTVFNKYYCTVIANQNTSIHQHSRQQQTYNAQAHRNA